MKRWDCFTFDGEFDLLLTRLVELDDVMDEFVMVEQTVTHQGDPKGLHWQSAKKTPFKKWMDRIHYVIVDDTPEFEGERGGAGRPYYQARERHQRQAILRGLNEAAPDDLIYVSDVDEIPHRCTVLGVHPGEGFVCFHMNIYAFAIDWHYPGRKELCTTVSTRKNCDPNRMRDLRSHMLSVSEGGWHFTWQGGPSAAYEKAQRFSHAELREKLTYEFLHRCWLYGFDVHGNDLIHVPVSHATHPKLMAEGKMKHLEKPEDPYPS